MPKKRLNLPKQRVVKAPANIIKRGLAFVFDLFLISFIIYPFETILRNIMPETTNFNEAYQTLLNSQDTTLITAISILMALTATIYFSVLEFRFQQSIGKIIARIYVVSDNKDLKFWQCIVRNLFLLPFIPFMLLWVIDPLYAIFNKENKRFSDVLAKTNVVEYHKM